MGLLDNFTNWAQSSQSQPAADGLLAAGLGILANNRGLTSGTQAIGMGGLQGLQAYQGSKRLQMDQQLQNAQLQQLQYGLQNNRMFMDIAKSYLGGGDPSQPQPQGQPQAAPQAPSAIPGADAGGMPIGGPASGPGVTSAPVSLGGPPAQGQVAGMPLQPGMPPVGSPAPAPQASPQAAPMSAIFGNIPKPLVAMGLLRDPNKTIESAMSQYSPTDLQKTMRAAGIDVNSPLGQQILQQSIAKQNANDYMAFRGGGYALNKTTGQMEQLPQAPDGFTAQRDQNGQWQMMPVAGGTAAMTASSGAKAAGTAGYQLTQVWDPTANGGKGGMVQQTVANTANAANGGAPGQADMPLPMRNNNPGAVSPGGSVAQYPTMQAGLQAMDGNLAKYASDPKVKTIGDAITKWVGSPPNAPAYIQDVTSRLGVPANTPIDLNNPAQRQALSTAIMLHENGSHAVFGQSGSQGSAAPAAQPQGGAFASAPPIGVTTNTDTSQKGGAEAMNTSFKALQGARASGQQALEGLDKMQGIAAKKSWAEAGPLGTNLTAINPAAAEYEKQRANVIAFLAGQNGTNGSDAGRALTGQSVPDYGKPQSAIKDGLGTLSNQIRLNMLKSNVLTPVFNQGDSKTYNDLENQFDQSVKPSMMPALSTVLAMPAGPTRAAALSNAAKDPQMRSALEVLIKGGALK